MTQTINQPIELDVPLYIKKVLWVYNEKLTNDTHLWAIDRKTFHQKLVSIFLRGFHYLTISDDNSEAYWTPLYPNAPYKTISCNDTISICFYGSGGANNSNSTHIFLS